jgi:putative DNA methylase
LKQVVKVPRPRLWQSSARRPRSPELAYRLYTVCERKKRAADSYNGLVQSWPEITRLAREGGIAQPAQAQLFEQE